jgi:hypothetical protein
MYDIEELEKKWIEYRKKRILRYVKIVSALTAGILVGVGIFTFVGNESGEDGSVKQVHTAKNESSEANRPGSTDSAPKEAVSDTHKSGSAGEKSEAELASMRAEVPSLKQSEKKSSNTKPAMEMTVADAGSVAESKSVKNTMSLEIVDSDSTKIVKDIEKRFEESNNFDDALFLSKYYYKKKNYKKASYWALQANMIDSTIEDSWILFAKSKVLQGHRVEALRVLQAYYDKTGSEQAKELLDLIRQGKKFD